MVSHGYEQVGEQRKSAGVPTRRWYRCHGCGTEYQISAGIRNSQGCNNPTCAHPNIHIHSDLDGEQPKQL